MRVAPAMRQRAGSGAALVVDDAAVRALAHVARPEVNRAGVLTGSGVRSHGEGVRAPHRAVCGDHAAREDVGNLVKDHVAHVRFCGLQHIVFREVDSLGVVVRVPERAARGKEGTESPTLLPVVRGVLLEKGIGQRLCVVEGHAHLERIS